MDSAPYRAFCKAFEAMQLQSEGSMRERFADKENRLGFEVITTPEGRGMAMIYDDKSGEVTIKIGPASEIRRRLTQAPNRRGRPKKMETTTTETTVNEGQEYKAPRKKHDPELGSFRVVNKMGTDELIRLVYWLRDNAIAKLVDTKNVIRVHVDLKDNPFGLPRHVSGIMTLYYSRRGWSLARPGTAPNRQPVEELQMDGMPAHWQEEGEEMKEEFKRKRGRPAKMKLSEKDPHLVSFYKDFPEFYTADAHDETAKVEWEKTCAMLNLDPSTWIPPSVVYRYYRLD
jgi:hypothetical protein|nr:MAG TPA: hypothetical protein [Caudoviricetes sp.]